MCGTISSAIGIGSVLTIAAIALTCCCKHSAKTSNQNKKQNLPQFIAEQEERLAIIVAIVQASWKIIDEQIV